MSEDPREAKENRENDEQGERSEKIWEATRKTWSNATFRATQYKRIVQKKIDLAALHRKIDSAHSDLGKLVDEARDSGEQTILERTDIQTLFDKLDEYKHNAATLEHEIEMIKAENEPANQKDAEEKKKAEDSTTEQ